MYVLETRTIRKLTSFNDIIIITKNVTLDNVDKHNTNQWWERGWWWAGGVMPLGSGEGDKQISINVLSTYTLHFFSV